jgi:ABC-type xylose transport system permease subunit
MSIALIVCLIGGIVYAIFVNLDRAPSFIAELGRLAFFAGLLAFLLKG